MIPLQLLKKIIFCIIVKSPTVIYLQRAELLPSVFFSISSNKCQLAGNKENATFKDFDNWFHVLNKYLFL